MANLQNMPRPIITVFGATGAQGGGLARALLDDGQFTVRAVTRKPDSQKAQALQRAGAQIVAADLDDVASLRRAVEGAWGAFLVTNYWELHSPEREKAQIRNLVRATREASVEHVIWSTLEDTRQFIPLDDQRMPTLMGNYKVPHLDAKGECDLLFTEAGIPTTFLRASFYWENFIYFGSGPRRAEDGSLELILPMGEKRLSGVGSEDIGRVARGIFQRGRELLGQTIGVAGEHLTGHEMAAKLSDVLPEPIHYRPLSPAAYRALGFPGAEELGNMFQFYQEFEAKLMAVRDVERCRALDPQLQDFTAWAAVNARRIPLPAIPA